MAFAGSAVGRVGERTAVDDRDRLPQEADVTRRRRPFSPDVAKEQQWPINWRPHEYCHVFSDGSLSPITALHAMVGAVVHPWEGLDIYAYAGMERADMNTFNSAAGLIGFGVPTLSNAGCGIVTGASFTAGISNCAAVNKEVDMVTIGFWQNLYKGDYGRLATGLQYEYVRRKSFDGVPGPVATSDNIVFSSLRYYPF